MSVSASQAFAAIVREHAPPLAVVLGSGLGGVPSGLEEVASIPFAEWPGLVAPSVAGHSGKFVLGRCGGLPLLVLRGRLHLYEGHSWERIAAPVVVAAGFKVKAILLTNAAGGIRDDLNPGDLMVLTNHVFLQYRQPVGLVSNLSGRKSPYSPRLVEVLRTLDAALPSGVYAAVTGPCYETPAEIRALRAMGADAVGMSTAIEAETAVQLAPEVAAISCITNKAAGLSPGTLDHAEVLANASRPAERLSAILESLVRRLAV
jgi:purine-nucleoside phosphorylase